MSRSTRQRKPVNYRKLLDDESDNSDDDFASGPPPKKLRGGPEGGSSMKGRGGDAQVKSAVMKEEPKKQTRLSRDEKQFSRQIEQALAASKKESGTNVSVSDDPIPDTSSINTSSTACTAERSTDDDFLPAHESISSDDSEGESFSAVEEDEDSDFSASPQPKKGKKKIAKENIKSAPKGRQTKAKKPKTANPNLSINKSSANSLPKKTAKPTNVKVTPAKPMVQKSTPSIARVPSLKVNSADSAKEFKSSLAKCEGGSPGVLGVNKRALNWTPPAKVGKTDALSSKPTHVRSGSSGGGGTPVIRVGLSRNARVKSLHANIKT